VVAEQRQGDNDHADLPKDRAIAGRQQVDQSGPVVDEIDVSSEIKSKRDVGCAQRRVHQRQVGGGRDIGERRHHGDDQDHLRDGGENEADPWIVPGRRGGVAIAEHAVDRCDGEND